MLRRALATPVYSHAWSDSACARHGSLLCLGSICGLTARLGFNLVVGLVMASPACCVRCVRRPVPGLDSLAGCDNAAQTKSEGTVAKWCGAHGVEGSFDQYSLRCRYVHGSQAHNMHRK